EVYPWAWAFFLVFILASTFTLLNLFIAVIVNAIQHENQAAAAAEEPPPNDSQVAALRAEIRALRAELRQSTPTRHRRRRGT
ncbi:MAG TPA: ion transporter, partial [Rhodocyclaceae bacterium]